MYRAHRSLLCILVVGLAAAGALVLGRPSAAQPLERDDARIKYTLDEWAYDYTIRALGSKSESRWGELSFHGKLLDTAMPWSLAVNDYIHTPWGTLFWWGRAPFHWGNNGWQPTAKPGAAKGKRLTPPGAPSDTVVLGVTDHGASVSISVGDRLAIYLPTGKRQPDVWSVAAAPGDLLDQAWNGVQESLHTPGWDMSYRHVFRWRAARAGTGTIHLRHGGPAEADWKLTVNVGEKGTLR